MDKWEVPKILGVDLDKFWGNWLQKIKKFGKYGMHQNQIIHIIPNRLLVLFLGRVTCDAQNEIKPVTLHGDSPLVRPLPGCHSL